MMSASCLSFAHDLSAGPLYYTLNISGAEGEHRLAAELGRIVQDWHVVGNGGSVTPLSVPGFHGEWVAAFAGSSRV